MENELSCLLKYATKLHDILLIGFGGVAMTNCFKITLNFGQTSKLKRDIAPIKKTWIRIFVNYVNLHGMY